MRQESALYAMSTDGTGRRLVLNEALLDVENEGSVLRITDQAGYVKIIDPQNKG
jgi:hypothetical protein